MTHRGLPESGAPWKRIKAEMDARRQGDLPWYGRRMLVGGSYFGGEDVVRIANRAYAEYMNFNALYAGKAFPSLVEMESELVEGLLGLARAPESASGSITTGGTESLLLAVMAARNWARERRPGVRSPRIVVPRAAHPAFDKAAHLMDLAIVRVDTGPDYRVDVDAVANAVDHDTIMVVGSAPSYPFGVNDDIQSLGALAQRAGLWLHVDACHGGFVLPFARTLGMGVAAWDYTVEGVTSISIDVHKLGYANKGVSALLLRDEELRRYQRYHFDDWPAGAYATDGISGSRSAGALASAWAVTRYLGMKGYEKIVGEILATRDRLVAGIRAIEALEVLGRPDAYLVAFRAPALDTFAIAEGMQERGWIQSRLSSPPAIHLFVDRAHAEVVEDYLDDLRQVVEAVRAGDLRARDPGAVYST